MEIATVILRLHPDLDHGQRQVVSHVDGPLLVIAGPGAGKTKTIQLRAVNLLLTGQADPGDLVLCTFGRDAASQLRQRFIQSALACGVPGDLSRVSVSTLHGLCHRLLASHADRVGLRPYYDLLDRQQQHLLLLREFDAIFGPDWGVLSDRGWRDGVHAVAEATRYFDRICDEVIDPVDLARSGRPFIAALGRCCLRYRERLLERNALDFGHLQAWADRVLRDGDIAASQGGAMRHLMVDEFQDISRVQMRILHRLGEVHGNIAVVGDDDQAIYRFRGASAENLLGFSATFPGCRVVKLTTNYRSHRAIVEACGRWMDTTAQWESAGRTHRFAKDIAANPGNANPGYPAVISVQGQDPVDEVRQLAELLRFMRHNGVIASYGQIALLLHSVRDAVSGRYLDGLYRAGIPARCEPAGHVRAPAGDEVLVTTIHQAKGAEWDVVVVGSLCGPDLETDRIGRTLADHGVHSGEPAGSISAFDRARLHYVAFSRARHLLLLTASGEPQARFRSIWWNAASWPDLDRASLSRQRFGMAETEPPRTVIEIEHLDRLVVRLAQPEPVIGSVRRLS